MEYLFKEVDFTTYCKSCKYTEIDDVKDPCNECLAEPKNLHSSKPVKWEDDGDGKDKK